MSAGPMPRHSRPGSPRKPARATSFRVWPKLCALRLAFAMIPTCDIPPMDFESHASCGDGLEPWRSQMRRVARLGAAVLVVLALGFPRLSSAEASAAESGAAAVQVSVIRATQEWFAAEIR